MTGLYRSLMVCSLAPVLLAGVLVALPGQQLAGQQEQPKRQITNSLGMKFVWIPPGTFIMGSPPGGGLLYGGDEKQFRVRISTGYYLGVHLVTQQQWQAVMGKNPSQFKGADLPVENVSWDDCQEFLQRLRKLERRNAYRLPTEAEWEYACRAGTTTAFHFGDTISTDQANFHGDFVYGKGKQGIYRGRTTPVDTFPANAWGLKDMHGNVYQWCADWYAPYPESNLNAANSCTQDYFNDQNGEARVVRGGGWNNSPWNSRSAARARVAPDFGVGNFGCRVCLPLE